jgi:hypothetical protein
MVRFSLSFLLSFVLFYVQCLIVMKLFDYDRGIYFDNYYYVFVVCVINFFLMYSILSQISPWLIKVNNIAAEEE